MDLNINSILSDVSYSFMGDYSEANQSSLPAYFERSLKADPLESLQEQELIELKRSEHSRGTLLSTARSSFSSKFPSVTLEEIPSVSKKISPHSGYSGALPTALAVCSHYIAIGNSSSQVSIFSSTGKFSKVLKKKDAGETMSLCFDQREEVVLAGFEGGFLCMWDVKSGSCLRSSNSAHKMPVTSLCFLKASRQFFASADLSGIIVESKISKSIFSSSIKSSVVWHFQICLDLKPLPDCRLNSGTYDLLAVSSLKSVLVMLNFNPIFELERPEGISHGTAPCVSWNHGQKTLLAIAWNLKISLFELKDTDDIQNLGYYEMDIEIKGCEWIDTDTMIGVSKMRELRVINLEEFNSDGHQHFEQEDSVPTDIVPQCLVKYESGKENMTLFNSIKRTEKRLCLLGKKTFSVFRFLDWKEILDKLIENKEWVQAMCFGLDVYQRKIRSGSTLEFIQKILQNFAREAASLLDNEDKIPYLIEFCIGIDSLPLFLSDFCLHDVRQFGKIAETLEPYIIEGEISTLNKEMLEKVVNHYHNEGKINTLEKVILNMNPKSLDIHFLIPKLKNRTSGIIFLCTQSAGDFLTPCSILYKAVTSAETPRELKQTSYKLLWYVRLCIKGELFPRGSISNIKYPEVLLTVINFLFADEQILRTLLEVDTQVTLDVIWEAFNGRAKTLPYFEKKRILNRLENELQGQYSFQLTIFIAKIASVDPEVVAKPVSLKIVKELLKPQRRLMNKTFSETTNIQKYIDMTVDLDTYSNEREYTVEEKGEIMKGILKNCTLESTEIEELLKIVISSPYSSVLVYLHQLKKNYSACILVFIRSESPWFRTKIFEWVQDIFQNGEDTDLIKEEMMKNLNSIVQIDPERTAELIKSWFHEDHSYIISELSNAPELQLKYIGKMVRSEEEVPEHLMWKYIELMCIYSKHEVLSFLHKHNDYVNQAALDICIQHSVHDATVYLHEELGDSTSALKLHLRLIDERRKQFPEEIVLLEQDIKSMVEQIESALELCARNGEGLDDEQNKEIWLPLLARVLNLYIDFVNTTIFPKIETLVTELSRKLLISMIDFVQFEQIMNYIDRYFGVVPLRYFKDSLIEILSRYSYQTNILKKGINLLSINMNNSTNNLFRLRNKGISSREMICATCQNIIMPKDMTNNMTNKIYVFICGHAYHSKCNKKDECVLCSDEALRI